MTANTTKTSTSTSSDLILSRSRKHDKYCCHCRQVETGENKLMRCARCKLTIYCSRDCQIQHFRVMHKHVCKALEKAKGGLGYGNFLFQVAYRSSDIPARSADMMEQVVDEYFKEGEQSDQLCFLLASLGHHKETMISIYNEAEVETQTLNFSIWNDLLPSDSTWSPTDVLIVALIKLKLIVLLRGDPTLLIDSNASTTNPKELLQVQELQLKHLVENHSGEQILLAIRDTIPLKPDTVPGLLVGSPSEFFLFVQDCFLLEPGINDLLHEYVKEEEYAV